MKTFQLRTRSNTTSHSSNLFSNICLLVHLPPRRDSTRSLEFNQTITNIPQQQRRGKISEFHNLSNQHKSFAYRLSYRLAHTSLHTLFPPTPFTPSFVPQPPSQKSWLRNASSLKGNPPSPGPLEYLSGR